MTACSIGLLRTMSARLGLPAAALLLGACGGDGVADGSDDAGGTMTSAPQGLRREPHSGVTLTDTAGSYRTWVIDGFGADRNPAAR